MLGSDSEGPARSKASAGPLPIPEANNPCMIGTSVSVAKYMNAPANEAKKFDDREFPPTALCIHSFGITPAMAVESCVEPSRKPAVITPIANNGSICFANPHAEIVHARLSSSCLSNSVISESAVMPTIMGTRGTKTGLEINIFASIAETIVAAAPLTTHHHFILRILVSE